MSAERFQDRSFGDNPWGDESSDAPNESEQSLGADAQESAEALAEQLEEAKRKARQYEAAVARAVTEQENAKQRIERDAAKELQRKQRGMLLSFLEVLDDLDRALTATQNSSQEEALRVGVHLVRKNFLQKLKDFDVVHVDCNGETFDPNRHEALSRIPVPTREQHNQVVSVMREGYWIGGDVLRAAQVAVGHCQDAEGADLAPKPDDSSTEEPSASPPSIDVEA